MKADKQASKQCLLPHQCWSSDSHAKRVLPTINACAGSNTLKYIPAPPDVLVQVSLAKAAVKLEGSQVVPSLSKLRGASRNVGPVNGTFGDAQGCGARQLITEGVLAERVDVAGISEQAIVGSKQGRGPLQQKMWDMALRTAGRLSGKCATTSVIGAKRRKLQCT